LAWATVVVAVLGVLSIQVRPAVADTAPVVTGPTFNDPTGDATEQNAILDHVADLIEGAVPGSSIRISMFTFGSNWLAGLLVDAKNRGVSVQLILDHDSLTDGEGAKAYPILQGLGAYSPSAGATASWVLVCPAGGACLAADPTPGNAYHGVNHNKFYLFSSTSGAAADASLAVGDVVVQTSANLTNWDRITAWNDALTVVGNTALFDAYGKYFGDLRDAGAGTKPKTLNYPVAVQAGPAKVYFFPRNGTDTDDVIVNILDAVDDKVGTNAICHGNTGGYGTTDGRTIIRVAMHQITRIDVAKKLWQLDNDGCYVDVLYAQLDVNGSAVSDQLHKATAYGGIALTKVSAPQATSVIHSKYMIIEGAYNGVPNQEIVFTGSHTYTISALHSNDETLLKYVDPTIYTDYRSDFWRIRDAGQPG
jgi:phosphatidylserine/phosphatidylglycerophosphate/cardiolipin synthase-like enzyme